MFRVGWIGLLLISLLLGGMPIPVSAAPAAAPAVDGDGLMDVTPTSVIYGSTGASLTFTFTANNDFVSGSQVSISIPAGWSAPRMGAGTGHISWSNGTCTLNGGPPVQVSASDILIDITSCTTGQYFTVTYSNATPGGIASSRYTFLIQTDIGPGGGGLTPINSPMPVVTIDPKPLSVSSSGLTPANKIYDGNTTASLSIGSPTLVGIVGSDVVTLDASGATGTFTDHNAGANKTVTISNLSLGGAQAANYTLTAPTRQATISPRPVTITALTDSKEYDGTVNSTQVPLISSGTPLVTGDSAPGLTQDFINKNAGANKTITPTGLIQDGNGGLNYAYTYVAVTTGTITPRPITVTAVTDSKIYDGTTSSAGLPVLSPGTPLVAGDIAPAWSQTFDSPTTGTGKLLIPSGSVMDGNSGQNYAYTFASDSTGVIGPRALSIAADAKLKIIGTADPLLTYQATAGSLAPTDSLVLTRTAGEALGTYPIGVGSFPAAANYTFSYTGADLTIAPAPVYNSVGTYDGWVLESTRTSNQGGSKNSTGPTFRIGDDAANRQYKVILSFDTSGLPDNAVVLKAILKIRQSGPPIGLNPFQALGGLLVDIRRSAFGTIGLAVTDFQATPSAAKVGTFGSTASGGWYKASISPAGRLFISTKGTTQFRLYFTKGDNNNLHPDFVAFHSGNDLTDQPQLVITYTIP